MMHRHLIQKIKTNQIQATDVIEILNFIYMRKEDFLDILIEAEVLEEISEDNSKIIKIKNFISLDESVYNDLYRMGVKNIIMNMSLSRNHKDFRFTYETPFHKEYLFFEEFYQCSMKMDVFLSNIFKPFKKLTLSIHDLRQNFDLIKLHQEIFNQLHPYPIKKETEDITEELLSLMDEIMNESDVLNYLDCFEEKYKNYDLILSYFNHKKSTDILFSNPKFWYHCITSKKMDLIDQCIENTYLPGNLNLVLLLIQTFSVSEIIELKKIVDVFGLKEINDQNFLENYNDIFDIIIDKKSTELNQFLLNSFSNESEIMKTLEDKIKKKYIDEIRFPVMKTKK